MARQAERGLLGLFLLALGVAPLPLASTRPWAVALLALWLAGVAAGAALLRALRSGMQGPARSSRSYPAAHSVPPISPIAPGGWAVLALLATYTAWAAWQASPWGYSADPHESRIYALRSAGYLAAFAAGLLLLAGSRRRQTALLATLVAAGVLQALLAIALYSTGKSYELLGFYAQFLRRATGTFPNFDHLAQYMALSLAAGVGLMLSQMGAARPSDRGLNWRERLHGLLEFVMSTKMLVRLGLVLMVIALVLTRSRAGNGVFFIAVLLLGVWVMATSAQLRRPAALLVASLLVVDIVVVGQWVGLEKVIQRLEATDLRSAQEEAVAAAQAQGGDIARLPTRPVKREESLEERWRAAGDALALVPQRPWAGHGGGTFYTIFPAVKGPNFAPYRWDHAHNDYVQIAVETGLVGLGLLAGVLLLTAGRALALMRDRAGAHARGVAAGVAMGLLCALLHALVDFNLQINANALVLIVLSALVWSVQGAQTRETPQTPPLRETHR